MATGRSGFDTVVMKWCPFIMSERERQVSPLSTLKLVDYVHGLTVSMGSYGVSEVRAGAGERVGGMVDGTNLTLGSIAGSGACGGGRLMGWRLVSTMSLWRLGGFQKLYHYLHSAGPTTRISCLGKSALSLLSYLLSYAFPGFPYCYIRL